MKQKLIEKYFYSNNKKQKAVFFCIGVQITNAKKMVEEFNKLSYS